MGSSTLRMRKWRQHNSQASRAKARREKLSKYGLTPAQYLALSEQQGHVCALCRKPETVENIKGSGVIRSLAVDHCHETGRVRGLLCGRCNRALGLLLDDSDVASRISGYLAQS